MTQITDRHVEWAVVQRLQSMLDGPPHTEYNVTQTYALFTTILCWVMQRIRVGETATNSEDDRSVIKLFKKLENSKISANPWDLPAIARVAVLEAQTFSIPESVGFEDHSVSRMLTNLRNATAHGDARRIEPFNIYIGSQINLVGFKFKCSEYKKEKLIWSGIITLLESDMRRLGRELAKQYCNAIRRSEPHRSDGNFGKDAAAIKEAAA